MEAQCSRKVSSQEKSKQLAYPAKCRCASLHTHVTALPFACPRTSDRPNVRFGQTVPPNFYRAVGAKWQNFFLQNTDFFSYYIQCQWHSALMPRLTKYSETQGNFFMLKTPCLPLKGKETPSIKHRWHWTVYPCGCRQWFFENRNTLRFHYTYWAPSILLR